MIDNPDQVERLLGKLDKQLPFAAAISPELADLIRKEAPGTDVPRQCQVTWIGYSGNEGGIVCKLDLGGGTGGKEFYTSITHLIVQPGMLLAYEITGYQKHRIKRLRSRS